MKAKTVTPDQTVTVVRPRGYKTISMLNSAEHEINFAHKC